MLPNSLQYEARHRRVHLDRLAKVALQHKPKPFRILDIERIVEAELRPERLAGRLRGVRSEQRLRRIAGRKTHEHEHDHGCAEEHREEVGEAGQDQAERHAPSSFSTIARRATAFATSAALATSQYQSSRKSTLAPWSCRELAAHASSTRIVE